MDDGWAGLVVLLLGDPHLLEGGQRGEDGSSDPDGVLALRGSDDLDLHGAERRANYFPFYFSRISNLGARAVISFCMRSAIPGYMVVPPDRTVLAYRSLRISMSHFMIELYLEESFGATEALVSDGDDLTVREFIGLLERGRGGGGGHLLFEVEGDVAELLLDVTDDFTLSGGGERVTTLGEDLHQVVSQVTSSEIETQDGVGESITLEEEDEKKLSDRS
ncbi:hypothetical protein WR25_02930 [Diploscapter pachys]|uniref:Uncharacterized protein n=1 Tax=Diploscapter pachys TaxID=2018661 RepID=A0A2A2JGF4_9BILA|nr:hypothetical protein WR25_02930 [Diploscapter pachys]